MKEVDIPFFIGCGVLVRANMLLLLLLTVHNDSAGRISHGGVRARWPLNTLACHQARTGVAIVLVAVIVHTRCIMTVIIITIAAHVTVTVVDTSTPTTNTV